MKNFICKECGHEGETKNVSTFSRIFGFILVIFLIMFVSVLFTVASQKTHSASDSMEVGAWFTYSLFAFIIYRISYKKGCSHCKSRNVIPANSPLGKKLKEQL